jgi:hypothetical protein
VAQQAFGFVHFKWLDASMCEDAFSFSRNNEQFVQDYAVTSRHPCGALHEPEQTRDDLRSFNPAIGDNITYWWESFR